VANKGDIPLVGIKGMLLILLGKVVIDWFKEEW
jgi:hypothetical protein